MTNEPNAPVRGEAGRGAERRSARGAFGLVHALFTAITVILLACIALFTYASEELYDGVTEGDGVAVLDYPALRTAVDIRTTPLTDVAVGFTEIGGRIGVPVLAVLASGIIAWRRRSIRSALILVPALLGSLVITVVGKRLTGRLRPPRDLGLPPFETSPSFPSGHTLNATVLAVIVGYLVVISFASLWGRMIAVAVCAVYAIGVGLSRVYLGQHWLTDVMAGMLIGLAWALSVILAARVAVVLYGRWGRGGSKELAQDQLGIGPHPTAPAGTKERMRPRRGDDERSR